MFRQLLVNIGKKLKKTRRFSAVLSQRIFSIKSSSAPKASAAQVDTNRTEPKQASLNHVEIPIIDFDEPPDLKIPAYRAPKNETLKTRKQRLIYQSRKRGMLENDLLLSTFAHKYLEQMDERQVALYDQLINGVSNDWDIYYWATETKPTPPEYDNEIMQMLKTHVKNAKMESQPEIN